MAANLLKEGTKALLGPAKKARRVEDSNRTFVSVCCKMLYDCQLKTYDARRSTAEGQAKPTRTSQLRRRLRTGHMWLRVLRFGLVQLLPHRMLRSLGGKNDFLFFLSTTYLKLHKPTRRRMVRRMCWHCHKLPRDRSDGLNQLVRQAGTYLFM